MNISEMIHKGMRCFDGGTGTMLMKLGLEIGGCPETAPADVMLSIHNAYIEAGAQYITTNTFGASRPKLAKYDLAEKTADINKRNTETARRAAIGKNVFVAGDIGPTGEIIEPYGSFAMEQFIEVFTEQALALAEGGADLFIIETMASKEELAAAIEACKSAASIPVIACMTFDRAAQGGFKTMMGVTPEEAVSLMQSSHADVCGANCTLSPTDMVELAQQYRALTKLPILMQPNAGKPRISNGKTFYDPIQNIEKVLTDLIAAGVDLAGGCCGTDPDYIRLLRKILDRSSREKLQ